MSEKNSPPRVTKAAVSLRHANIELGFALALTTLDESREALDFGDHADDAEQIGVFSFRGVWGESGSMR